MRPGLRLRILLSTAISIAVATAGCGGAGDTKTGANATVAAPSKAEFIRQANEACRRERSGLTKRVSDFERQRGLREPLPGADMVHLVYLPMLEAQMWRIEKIGTPRGEAGRIDALFDAERGGVDAAAVRALVPSIAAANRHFAKADRLFRAYGLPACATDAEPSANSAS